jgi:hypothetical protein
VKLNNWGDKDKARLREFYSDGQAWKWEEIEKRSSKPGIAIADWLDNLPTPWRRPIVLPFMRGAKSSWMAIAFSESQSEELRELLNAFVGRICTSFNGMRTAVDSSDPLHRTAKEWAGGERFFELNYDNHQRSRVRESLGLMLDVLKQRVDTDSAILRTSEGLLREFSLALINGNQVAARELLDTIRQTGRFGADNLGFLRIEYQAAFGMWRDMRFGSDWPLLVRGRRPRRITVSMIEALWRVDFERFKNDLDVDKALEVMAEKILPDCSALFRHHRLPMNEVGSVTMLLAAACNPVGRRGQAALVLERVPKDSPLRGFAEKVFEKFPAGDAGGVVQKLEPLDDVRRCLQSDDYEGAWELLQECPASVDRCRLMLQCCYEFRSREAASVVCQAVLSLSEAERVELLKRRVTVDQWEEAEALSTVEPAISSWEHWFDHLATGAAFRASSEVAETCNLADYRMQLARVANLGKRIEEVASTDANSLLRAAVPDIVEFFILPTGPEAEFLPVYAGLLNAIAFSDQVSSQDWETVETLASAILGVGLSPMQYTDMVETLTLFWDGRNELVRIDWALDQLDALITGPNLGQKALLGFYEKVRNACTKYARRMDPGQRRYFGLLCDDLQRSEEFAGIPWRVGDEKGASVGETEEERVSAMLENRSVGIYSLTESAAKRAGKLIQAMNASVKIRLSHDHVGTEQLRVVARDSDFLVVVTQSAKHAATDFIKQERAEGGRDLIYPEGRGAASIVNALKKRVLGGLC